MFENHRWRRAIPRRSEPRSRRPSGVVPLEVGPDAWSELSVRLTLRMLVASG